MAADVKHSFDTLMSKEAAPQYRVIFGDVAKAVVAGPRAVRFEFKRVSLELPLMVGGIPVFSRAWGAGKPFDKVVMDIPIASGPYRIGRLNFGRDITYERDPNYWARDLNVRRGLYNFDRVTYKIYKDTTAQTEAFKAGEFDYLEVFGARAWARTYTGKKFDSGELIKKELPAKNAADFQGYLINTRREKFKDPRVREALGLAYDFEWMNRQLFYNSFTRVRGFFNGSDFEAKGLPGADELAVLKPIRDKLPAKIFTEEVPLPPSTAAPGSLRANLIKAKQLLAEAGWTYRDGALRNAKGEAFTIEYLDGGSRGEITTSAYARGAGQARYRTQLPARGLRADPEASRRIRFRLVHGAHTRQRMARRRTAGPVRFEIGRHRGLQQLDGRARPERRLPGEPRGVVHDARRAYCAPARARSRAAARLLRGSAVLPQWIPDRLSGRQVRTTCRGAELLSGGRLGSLHVVDKTIGCPPCGRTYSSACC